MSYRTIEVAAQYSRPVDPIILGSRAAIADYARGYARAALTATDAGIDRETIAQRLTLRWMQAARASRLLRGIPSALIQWAFHVEYQVSRGGDANGGYPECPVGTVGTFNAGTVTSMPGHMYLIQAGGVRLVAQASEEVPMHQVVEVRLSGDADSAKVVFVLNTARDSRRDMDDPTSDEPADSPELEREDV